MELTKQATRFLEALTLTNPAKGNPKQLVSELRKVKGDHVKMAQVYMNTIAAQQVEQTEEIFANAYTALYAEAKRVLTGLVPDNKLQEEISKRYGIPLQWITEHAE